MLVRNWAGNSCRFCSNNHDFTINKQLPKFLNPVLVLLLLSISYVQWESCSLLPKHACQSCTFGVTVPCWCLIWFIVSYLNRIVGYLLLGTCVMTFGTTNVNFQGRTFISVPAQGFLVVVFEIHGVFCNRHLLSTCGEEGRWQAKAIAINFSFRESLVQSQPTIRKETSHVSYLKFC